MREPRRRSRTLRRGLRWSVPWSIVTTTTARTAAAAADRRDRPRDAGPCCRARRPARARARSRRPRGAARHRAGSRRRRLLHGDELARRAHRPPWLQPDDAPVGPPRARRPRTASIPTELDDEPTGELVLPVAAAAAVRSAAASSTSTTTAGPRPAGVPSRRSPSTGRCATRRAIEAARSPARPSAGPTHCREAAFATLIRRFIAGRAAGAVRSGQPGPRQRGVARPRPCARACGASPGCTTSSTESRPSTTPASPARSRSRWSAHHHSWSGLPASLAMVIAAAKAHEDGALEQSYDFRPRLLWDQRAARARWPPAAPASSCSPTTSGRRRGNLSQTALVKAAEPAPRDRPRRARHPEVPGRRRALLRRQPPRRRGRARRGRGHLRRHARRPARRGRRRAARPAVLGDVAGLSFRHGDGSCRPPTATASPISTRSRHPSSPGCTTASSRPARWARIIMETNRGCPYGCTFCDWGSATLSRVRKFDLDRVFAELEWCGPPPDRDGRHRRRQLRHLRARRRDRPEDRRAQGRRTATRSSSATTTPRTR